MTRPKMLSLEMGRGIAAVSVMLFHLEDCSYTTLGAYPFNNVFVWGHGGVAYFFVLSGLLMTLVHNRDLGRPGMAQRFLLRRGLRILPMLWTVVFGLAALHLAFPSMSRTTVSPSGLLADMMLFPYPGQLTLNPIWTLKREALFYALFAIVIYRPKVGLPMLGVWQGLSLLNIILPFTTSFYGLYFFDAYNLGFGVGIVAALVYLRLPHHVRLSNACVIAGGGGLVVISAWEWFIGHTLAPDAINPFGVELEPALQVIAAAMLIYGLLDLERAGLLCVPRWAAFAGSVSYVLYLIHEPLITMSTKLVATIYDGVSGEAFYVFTVIGVVLISVAVHRWFERPLQASMSWLLLARSRAVAAQSPFEESPVGDPA